MTQYPLRRTRRQAFTLIEILVVLAIVAIVSSITLGGYKEMTSGNKRVSCQTNLVQIYQAARLYAGDEGGKFPFYGNISAGGTDVTPFDCTSTTNNTGIGLWSLYTFSNSSFTLPDENKPIERYLRSAKVLHCPSHIQNKSLLSPTNIYDPAYLSYQSCDGTVPTYSSQRTMKTDGSEGPWKRQLLHYTADGAADADLKADFVSRLPEGNTVVTWCPFHRSERGMDNVLFYDGTVQLIPQNQAGVTGWQRIPKPPV